MATATPVRRPRHRPWCATRRAAIAPEPKYLRNQSPLRSMSGDKFTLRTVRQTRPSEGARVGHERGTLLRPALPRCVQRKYKSWERLEPLHPTLRAHAHTTRSQGRNASVPNPVPPKAAVVSTALETPCCQSATSCIWCMVRSAALARPGTRADPARRDRTSIELGSLPRSRMSS